MDKMKARIELKKGRVHEDNKTNGVQNLIDEMRDDKCKRRSSGVLFKNRKQLAGREKNSEFKPNDPLDQNGRMSVMEGFVQICKGTTIKERCLFLYNDLLVIAKEKSRQKYTLKEWIRLSDMWLDLYSVPQFIPQSPCLHHLSFVIGWPPSENQVAVFTNKNIRDIWYQVLQDHIAVAREKEKTSLPIKISLDDQSYSVTKSLMVSNKETALNLVERCITEFRLQSKKSTDFQLHISAEDDENPRPIYGFESPFSIYTNLLKSAKFTSLTNFLPEIKLLLKSKIKTKSPGEDKNTPRNKMGLLKRMLSKGCSPGKLFGRELGELIEYNELCPALLTILGEIYVNGPICTGIFRKCAGPQVKSIKAQLDAGDDPVLDDVYIHDMASLLKEFLRSMPDCLLTSALYSDWMRVASLPSREFSVEQIKRLVHSLPQSHLVLLKHLLCVLDSVAQSADLNLMSPYNIAVCISQCILWSGVAITPSSMPNIASISSFPSFASIEQYNDITKTNLLVQFLIENCAEICGPECLKLYDHLSQRKDSVLATGSPSQRSTDSDSSQTSINALKSKNTEALSFLKSKQTLHSKRGMYASTPMLSMADI